MGNEVKCKWYLVEHEEYNYILHKYFLEKQKQVHERTSGNLYRTSDVYSINLPFVNINLLSFANNIPKTQLKSILKN